MNDHTVTLELQVTFSRYLVLIYRPILSYKFAQRGLLNLSAHLILPISRVITLVASFTFVMNLVFSKDTCNPAVAATLIIFSVISAMSSEKASFLPHKDSTLDIQGLKFFTPLSNDFFNIKGGRHFVNTNLQCCVLAVVTYKIRDLRI